MRATVYNIEIEQGANFALHLDWVDPSGVPINLATKTARMQVRAKPGATVVLLLTTENGRITLGVGTIDLLVQANVTAQLPANGTLYRYDLEIIHSPTSIDRLLTGTLRIIPNITTEVSS